MMLKQVANKAQVVPNIVRQFSTTSIALAGRQGPPQRRKAEKKFDVDFMPKFDFDDQTTIGHNLFENIREVRQYLRKAEFELPKLNGKILILLKQREIKAVFLTLLTHTLAFFFFLIR
jgi:hypothetical protein